MSIKFETARRVVGYRAEVEDFADIVTCGETCVLIVADGVGGRPGGAQAAELAVKMTREAASTQAGLDDAEMWRGLLSEVDAAIDDDPQAGETTGVIAAMTPRGIVGASIGDSEAWLVTADGCEILTRHQERKPFLGYGAAWPQTFAVRAFSGTLLLASDGLFKYADSDAICARARQTDLETAAQSLVDLVRLPSGALWDDVSVLLCRAVTL